MPKLIDYGALERYEPRGDAPGAYLVDLDGTACLKGDRSPYDETRVLCDTPNESVLRVIHALATDAAIVFMSGRSEKCRPDTEEWLRQHYAAPHQGLFMRAAGDTRTDWIVKHELFNQHVRDRYRVLGVFDDRNQVVGMWRALGLTVFQVADGDF